MFLLNASGFFIFCIFQHLLLRYSSSRCCGRSDPVCSLQSKNLKITNRRFFFLRIFNSDFLFYIFFLPKANQPANRSNPHPFKITRNNNHFFFHGNWIFFYRKISFHPPARMRPFKMKLMNFNERFHFLELIQPPPLTS